MQMLLQPKQPNSCEFLYVNINWDQLIFDADLLILILVCALAPAVCVALGNPAFLCLNEAWLSRCSPHPQAEPAAITASER